MIEAFLAGVGILGPGLPDWPAARRVLARAEPWRATQVAEPRPESLPPNERRRGARTARWAIAVGEEALCGSGVAAADAAAVFASSSGDGETLAQICEALAQPAREMSPTRFHNSVHNAACGYWSIAAGSGRPAVALCAHDASFGAALLEAGAQIAGGERAVLLAAYDLPYPAPLDAARPLGQPLAVALLLCGEERSRTLARLRLESASAAQAPAVAPVEPLAFAANPAGRALPLLACVARGEAAVVRVDLPGGGALAVTTRP
ncbi:MAG TPA: beta-ketoacyl synthase chain length factor [Burkholderiales bacterium]|jgi:hypothetical protein